MAFSSCVVESCESFRLARHRTSLPTDQIALTRMATRSESSVRPISINPDCEKKSGESRESGEDPLPDLGSKETQRPEMGLQPSWQPGLATEG
jgi:hypothetical protein